MTNKEINVNALVASLKSVADANWETQKLNAKGEVIQKRGCFGRIFCRPNATSKDLLGGLSSIRNLILQFPEEAKSCEAFVQIANNAVEKANALVERVNQKREAKKKETIQIEGGALQKIVVEKKVEGTDTNANAIVSAQMQVTASAPSETEEHSETEGKAEKVEGEQQTAQTEVVAETTSTTVAETGADDSDSDDEDDAKIKAPTPRSSLVDPSLVNASRKEGSSENPPLEQRLDDFLAQTKALGLSGRPMTRQSGRRALLEQTEPASQRVSGRRGALAQVKEADSDDEDNQPAQAAASSSPSFASQTARHVRFNLQQLDAEQPKRVLPLRSRVVNVY